MNQVNWHFTKEEAEKNYKVAIQKSKKPVPLGVPFDYIKKNIGGKPYYYVGAYFGDRGRHEYVCELWKKYGFLVHSKFPGEIYVRRK